MKKLLLVLAIGAFVACNDNADGDGSTTDTVPTSLPVDTNTTMSPVDTSMNSSDTTGRAVDTLKK